MPSAQVAAMKLSVLVQFMTLSELIHQCLKNKTENKSLFIVSSNICCVPATRQTLLGLEANKPHTPCLHGPAF